MDLKRMRSNKEFTAFLEPAEIEAACKKLDFRSYFGDQDWWNMVVWSAPHMRYNLDCGFNYQVSQDFNNDIMDEVLKEHNILTYTKSILTKILAWNLQILSFMQESCDDQAWSR